MRGRVTTGLPAAIEALSSVAFIPLDRGNLAPSACGRDSRPACSAKQRLLESKNYQNDRRTYTLHPCLMPPVPMLTDGDVLTQIRDLAARWKFLWTTHAEIRLKERGVDKGVARECLMVGSFSELPHIPNRFGDIEYKFTMQCVIDDELVQVAASLQPAKKIVVITVIVD